MSKSLGNTVDPVDIAKRMGGEIVRFWVASVDFREDVRASENLMARVAENYRKIATPSAISLETCTDCTRAGPRSFEQMEPIDQYMLMRTADLVSEVCAWYDQMLIHRIYQRLNEFFRRFSAQYFDILKDRLYTFPPPRANASRRRPRSGVSVRLLSA